MRLRLVILHDICKRNVFGLIKFQQAPLVQEAFLRVDLTGEEVVEDTPHAVNDALIGARLSNRLDGSPESIFLVDVVMCQEGIARPYIRIGDPQYQGLQNSLICGLKIHPKRSHELSGVNLHHVVAESHRLSA